MSKKIILFGPIPPPFGGVAVFMNALYQHLKHYGVRMWAYGGKEKVDPNINFIRHRQLAVVPALIHEGCKARIVDCSHFHLEYPNAILVPIWVVLKLLLRFEWLKIICDGSLPIRYSNFSLLEKGMFRMAVRFVTDFVVTSTALDRWLRNEIKVTQSVFVVPSLLPVTQYDLNGSLPQELEKSLSRYSKRICSMGSFNQSYGFDQVVGAVEKIRSELRQDIALILITGGFGVDEDYRSRVVEGRDWITVLTDVPQSVVFQILTACDVFVRSVAVESYGISRVEAIWCGLPVVATRTGETRGMLLYDYGDESGLILQLKSALNAPPLETIESCARQFRREAKENLATLMKILQVNEL